MIAIVAHMISHNCLLPVMWSTTILKTSEPCIVMCCGFLRIETPVTKLSMNTASLRAITKAFITGASGITLDFPFHFSKTSICLEDAWRMTEQMSVILTLSLGLVLSTCGAEPPTPAEWLPGDGPPQVSPWCSVTETLSGGLLLTSGTSSWTEMENQEVEIDRDPGLCLLFLLIPTKGVQRMARRLVFCNKVLLVYHLLVCLHMCAAAFGLQQQHWVTGKKPIWTINPTRFGTWSLGLNTRLPFEDNQGLTLGI